MTSDDNGESGASLIFAVLFVMVVGVVVAAMLPFIGEGIGAARTVSDVRSVQHAADGAVEGAISSIRGSLVLGSNRGTCPTYNAPPYHQPIGSDLNAVVTCKNVGGTSLTGDQPPFSILTVNGDIALDGNNPLTIDGGIFANGKVCFVSGSNCDETPQSQQDVVVFGDAYATGDCPTTLVVTAGGVKHCNIPALDPDLALGADPAYPKGVSSVPVKADPLGTCTSTSSVVTFVPGYYSAPPQVDPVSCAGNQSGSPSPVWWFSPGQPLPPPGSDAGVYYFDLADGSYPGFSDADAAWNLGNHTIIGGSLVVGGGSPPSAASLTAFAAGSRCNPAGVGVQVMVGGPTAITVAANDNLELCGSRTSLSPQRIALYGVPTGPVRGTASSNAAPPAPPTGDFTPLANSAAIDTTLASKTSMSKNQVAAQTLSGFPTPPDGSLITSAMLHVAHKETSNINDALSVTFGSGVTKDYSSSLSKRAALGTDDVNILSDLAVPLRWKDLVGLTATYSATATKNNEDAYLDGIQLDVTYVAPAFEATRCESSASKPCYLLTNTVANNTFVTGTIYAPKAPLNVTVHNKNDTIFGRGVICSSLLAHINASSKQIDSPFQLPGGSASREVLFTASISGRVRLRARVLYQDWIQAPDGTQSVFPGRIVTVEKWTVVR